MAFNLEVFRSSVMEQGVIKPSKFRIRVFPPSGLAMGAALDGQMELWGEMAEIPLFSLEAGQMKRFGYGSPEKRPVAPVYQDISLEFICDGGGQIWNFFKEWLRLIVQNTGQEGPELYELAYKVDYLADMEITVFRETGEPAFMATLIDAYPITLETMKVEWRDNRDYMRVPVRITFTDWIGQVMEGEGGAGTGEGVPLK